jgi:hypothetical protein
MRKFRRRKTHLIQREKQSLEEIEDWQKLYSKNLETKKILKEENNEMYLKCEELEKNKSGNVLQIDKVKDSSEECSCDIDVDCAYCLAVYENEKGLVEEVQWTAEDDAAELKEYRDMTNKVRREKYQEKIKKAMAPIPALPERELCEYEKIRKNNIAQMKRELAEHEAKWEAEWEAKK